MFGSWCMQTWRISGIDVVDLWNCNQKNIQAWSLAWSSKNDDKQLNKKWRGLKITSQDNFWIVMYADPKDLQYQHKGNFEKFQT